MDNAKPYPARLTSKVIRPVLRSACTSGLSGWAAPTSGTPTDEVERPGSRCSAPPPRAQLKNSQ